MTEIIPINFGCPLLVDEDVYLKISHYKFVLRIDRRVARAIHQHVFGDVPKGMHVDHIDRNPLNYQKENLRIVTPSENMRNKGDIIEKSNPDIRQAEIREE